MHENMAKLIELIVLNRDMRVVPMVSSEIVADDAYDSWLASIGESRVDDMWQDDDRIYFKSLDEDEIEEKFAEFIFLEDESISEKDLELKIDAAMRTVPEWEKVIVLNIDLP